MFFRSSIFLLMTFMASAIFAGTGYEVTSKQDGKTVTYMVIFGGGFRFEQHTAFDPVTKKFVYLRWNRGKEAPKPAGIIWDHETGKTIKLYAFPDSKTPLPVIPSIKAIKVCPITGSKDFTAVARIAID